MRMRPDTPLPPGLHHDDLAVRDAFVPRMAALAAAVGVDVPAEVVVACGTHYALLVRWNKTHNLSRIVDVDDAALKHYLDCVAPLVRTLADLAAASPTPARVIDVGSGAGFPGLVARMVWEATGWRGTPWAQAPLVQRAESVGAPEVVLVEPARKRQSFLTVAVRALGLSGVHVVSPPPAGRVQGALVLTRATFSAEARQQLWPYVAPHGVLLAWTTPHERSMWQTEVATWPRARATWSEMPLGELQRAILSVRHVPEADANAG